MSVPQVDGRAVSLIVQLDHQRIEVTEVEHNRHSEFSVDLECIKEKPINQRFARLSLVRPSPGGPAGRGEDPKSPSHLLAGTVSSVFPLRGAQELRAAAPAVPTLRVGFVNGMSYQ